MSKTRRSASSVSQVVTSHVDNNNILTDKKRRTWRQLLRPEVIEHAVLVADVLLIMATGLVCSLAYHWVIGGGFDKVAAYVGVAVVVAANFSAIMAARDNYRLKRLTLKSKQIRQTIVVWSGTYGLLAAAAFTMKISEVFSRGSLILFFAGGLVALIVFRWMVAEFILRSLANGSFVPKKIIVVTERGLDHLSGAMKELRLYGFYPVRTCEITNAEIQSPGMASSLHAKLLDLIQAARNERIEDIYILVRWQHQRIIKSIVDALVVLPISIHLMPDESASRFLSHPISRVGDTWTAVLQRAPLSTGERLAKRCVDVVLATAALVTLLPLLLVTALFIKLDSRGPVFFVQTRDGFNGGTFGIYKFRTMHVMEDGPEVKQATRDDPRVTRIGRWLRRSSIDELPQLFNVISGEMSLVGPRPHAKAHNTEYSKLIANYAFRHHVKPGLTGWAQVNGYRGETRHIEQMKGRVEHDLWYINNWSLLLDIKILLRTLIIALRQDAAY
jgi:Undecaprenyl-phosphate glucose phosphotransferase